MENDPTDPTYPYKFSSSNVSIACGGAVKLTNNSATTHTFSPTSGGFKNSGDINAGAATTVRFFYKGSYGFVCAYHSWMTGTIHVT
jgi:plastocyanin